MAPLDKQGEYGASNSNEAAKANPDAITCACCQVPFDTRELYVVHSKSGWHKENNKRKMFGRQILSEEQWLAEFGEKEKKAEEAAKKEAEEKEAKKKEADRLDAEREQREKERQEEKRKEEEEQKSQEAALAGDEALICVVFDYKAERWNHKFTIKKGCTVLDLKQQMVKPDAPEEEVVSFDLTKRRIRLNNYDTIDAADTYEFLYIGPEAGMQKKAKDKEQKELKEEQARQFRLREEQRKAETDKKNAEQAVKEETSLEAKRRKQEEERQAEKARAEKEKADKEAELAKPFVEDTSGPPVDVVVKHLQKGRSLTVTVPNTCSIGFVKNAVLETIGKNIEFDLGLKGPAKDIQKLIPGLDAFHPNERLGKHRELFTMGPIELIVNAKVAAEKAAAAKAAGQVVAKPGETLYHIEHDTDGDKISVSMPKRQTVMHLKRAICAQVCRGTYTNVVLASSSGVILQDKQELDKFSAEERGNIRVAGVQICPAFPVKLRIVHAQDVDKNLARIIEVTVDDTAKIEDIRTLVAKERKGKLMDIKIVGKMSGSSAVSSMADGIRLNGKKEVLGMGKLMDNCSLAPRVEEAAAAPKAATAKKSAAKKKSDEEGPVPMDKAIQLQEELLRGFSDESFQLANKALIARYPDTNTLEFKQAQADLLLTVQSQVLPKYGFTGEGTKPVRAMMKVMPGGTHGLKSPFTESQPPPDSDWFKLFDNQGMIQWLLGLPNLPGWIHPNDRQKAAEEEAAARPTFDPNGPKVDLRIQLDPDDELMEQDVAAPVGADILWVKEKLCSLDPTGSTQLNSFQLANYGGSTMVPLPDSEKITTSRRLVILQT